MSMITRCPACRTMFKVVQDQLRISEGWVRCGQCDEIFDASLHLQPVPASVEVPVAEQSVPEAVSHEIDGSTGFVESSAAHDLPLSVPDGMDEFSADPVLPDTIESAEVVQPLPEPILSDVPTSVLPGPVVDAENFERDEELSDVTFLHGDTGNSFWSKPIVRVTLFMLNLLLVLGLAGQMAFHERDRMVALEPMLKPWFLVLCESLNCTLSPLRRIESMVIDSSSFVRIRGDSFRLNFLLRNTALATPLAAPAIELTLTDTLDQPLVRRVFLPSELGLKSDALAAGIEWPASLAITVQNGDRTGKVAGYRLLAFYP